MTELSRTQDEALEEEIDPAHNDHLGDHHHHLRLHTSHHTVHGCRVGHRVRRCRGVVTFRWAIFEVLSGLVSFRKVARDGLIECRGYRRIRRGSPENLRTRQGSPGRTVTKNFTTLKRSLQTVRGWLLEATSWVEIGGEGQHNAVGFPPKSEGGCSCQLGRI
jgi:hypothetical protein